MILENLKVCTEMQNIAIRASERIEEEAHIKELEAHIKELEFQNEILNDRLKFEKERNPKWISVVERLPTKEDADVDGDVLASNHVYPKGLFCHYGDIHKLGITHWLYNLQPPTTEKSSSVEEG